MRFFYTCVQHRNHLTRPCTPLKRTRNHAYTRGAVEHCRLLKHVLVHAENLGVTQQRLHVLRRSLQRHAREVFESFKTSHVLSRPRTHIGSCGN